jgi:PadR family transcriptional regulator PadR
MYNANDTIKSAKDYAADLTVQLKKGVLTQCVLLAAESPVYTSEILAKLEKAELDIVEGTIYPLLSRLAREGLLVHEWKESPQGPPRKYYKITDYGRAIRIELTTSIRKLNNVIENLEGESNE